MTAKLFRYTGWIIVLSASLYFIYTNALHYFSYTSDSFGPDLWPVAPFLLTHIVGGMLALLLGPFQFISSIRKNHVRVHHTIGKIYLCSILFGAMASLYVSVQAAILAEHLIAFSVGLIGLAIAWLLTAGMAYWAIRNKNFTQHREWMVRSYVVTCAFTTFRLFQTVLIAQFHLDPGQTVSMMAWACWAFPLLVTEAILQGQKIQRGARAIRKKKENAATTHVILTNTIINQKQS